MIDRLRAARVIAILRLRDYGLSVEVGHALVGAGLSAIEVTLDHPDALDALRRLATDLPRDVVVGAGTVRQPEQVAAAVDAGARFCASPHTDAKLIAACLERGVEPLPGALTPTEVTAALDAGARVVKLFPAGPVGTGYLRALLGPFRDLAVVPTGGIRSGEVARWLDAGAIAVGLGSDLVPAEPAGAMQAIAERAQQVALQAARARVDLARSR